MSEISSYVSPSCCSSLLYAHSSAVNVESEGPYQPERLLPEAIKVMREKIATIRQAAEALLDHGPGDGDVSMADS